MWTGLNTIWDDALLVYSVIWCHTDSLLLRESEKVGAPGKSSLPSSLTKIQVLPDFLPEKPSVQQPIWNILVLIMDYS